MVTTAPDQCATNDQWHQRRGEIAQLRFVLGIEENARDQYDNFNELEFDDEGSDDGKNELEQ